VRSTLIALALVTGGCLVEYVLPEGDSLGDQGNTQSSATNDPAPTTGTGDPDLMGDGRTTGDACDAGLMLCGDDCVDLEGGDAHCGTCDAYCEDDQMCIASECRDILVVECTACPCDACSAGDGELESTSGDGEPSMYLCCPPAEGPDTGDTRGTGDTGDTGDTRDTGDTGDTGDTADTVVCVVGDPEDLLVCPEDP